MTPTQFTNWLAAMKAAGLARSDADCARLLGVHVNTLVNRKRDGADRETALACSALLNGVAPHC